MDTALGQKCFKHEQSGTARNGRSSFGPCFPVKQRAGGFVDACHFNISETWYLVVSREPIKYFENLKFQHIKTIYL